MKPPFTSKRLWGTVNLETGIAEAPTAAIPIYATVVPRVTARPTFIGMPETPQENWRQSLTLVWSDSAQFKILGVKADDPALSVKVDRSRGKAQLIVTAAEGSWPKLGSYMITVETDDPEAPSVLVPVNVGDIARRPKRKAAPTARETKKERKTEAPKPVMAKPKTTKTPTTP